MDKTEQLARAFAAMLYYVLEERQMQTVVDRNRAEYSDEVCHSHDFCDSIEIMNLALKYVTGSWYEPCDETDEFVNRAWTLAKSKDFYMTKGN